MAKPLIREDLVDAAAALVLAQHDSPYVQCYAKDGQYLWETEPFLEDTREAASKYLVACFNAAAIWNADDE